MCPHGGTITATPSATHARADAPVLRASDSFVVVGCSFATPAGPHPCVSVQWVQTALKVKHGGDFVLAESSVGLCVAGDQAPQGTVVISSTQSAVSGL
jgi:hypothetical protein